VREEDGGDPGHEPESPERTTAAEQRLERGGHNDRRKDERHEQQRAHDGPSRKRKARDDERRG